MKIIKIIEEDLGADLMRNLTERRQSQGDWSDEELFGTPQQPQSTPQQPQSEEEWDDEELFPGAGDGKKPGRIGSASSEYLKDLKKQIQDYLSPLTDYFKDLRDARFAEFEQMKEVGDDPTAWAKAKLETGTDTLLHSAVNKARKGTAFLNNFIAQTKKELNTAKIPNTPKADIGKAPGLRKRVNTKGF